jgi:hypothetical protein
MLHSAYQQRSGICLMVGAITLAHNPPQGKSPQLIAETRTLLQTLWILRATLALPKWLKP